jgi:hypothetical protein
MKILLSTIVSALLLLSGSAYAKGPKDVNVVNVPNVNVTNVPDVNVINFPEGGSDVNVINTPDVYVVGGVEITNNDTNPIPVTIESGSSALTAIEWRFLGITSLQTTGAMHLGLASGYSAMNIMCDLEFGGGKGARACTSEEIKHSIVPTFHDSAWVNPTTTLRLVKPDGSIVLYDPHVPRYSASLDHTLDCGSWIIGQSNGRGLVVYTTTGNMFMSPSRCDHENPVACCAPRAVPVQ